MANEKERENSSLWEARLMQY